MGVVSLVLSLDKQRKYSNSVFSRKDKNYGMLKISLYPYNVLSFFDFATFLGL